jgi:3-hydroxyisobutyrate dehydrogenase-like beta-hydroxyacid dehydrogenase
MSIQPNQSIGIIGMGLMGSALMRMTGAERGWDVDPRRCECVTMAHDVFEHCDVVFLCLPNSDIVRSVLRRRQTAAGQIIIDTTTGDPKEMAALGAELAAQGRALPRCDRFRQQCAAFAARRARHGRR